MSTKATINEILKEEHINFKRYLSSHAIFAIKNLLEADHGISVIPEEEYDAILVSSHPIKEGEVSFGYIFNDRKKDRPYGPFENGEGVRTSTIQEIVEPVQGLYLAKTRNTTYLVI